MFPAASIRYVLPSPVSGKAAGTAGWSTGQSAPTTIMPLSSPSISHRGVPETASIACWPVRESITATSPEPSTHGGGGGGGGAAMISGTTTAGTAAACTPATSTGGGGMGVEVGVDVAGLGGGAL